MLNYEKLNKILNGKNILLEHMHLFLRNFIDRIIKQIVLRVEQRVRKNDKVNYSLDEIRYFV
ncbi:MAG: hypothetical protein LBT66_04560, partial [Methanobrevibacter sp.]|nr:hypothetical protein [Candidatus Methanovirga meridionalis]